MQWEALRDAYAERFGKLFDWREVGDEQGRRPPFWLLVFWDPEVPAAPVVYASFGAPGRQVYVVSAVPIFALEEALGEATVVAPPLPAPYDLLRTQATRTQFKGFLVAPPEDGSFVVGDDASGRIEVHRLVPVTHAERVLAADKDPREAYRRVREAGALAADPVRTCTVEPKLTDRWKKYDAPGLVRILREHLDEVEQRRAKLRKAAAAPTQLHWYELETVEVRAYLRHLEAGLPPVLTEDAVVASIRSGPVPERPVRLRDALVDRAFTAPGAFMPDRVRAGVQEFIGFLILTHPEALRIVEAIVHEPLLPPAAEGDAAVLRSCTDQMVKVVGILHPEHTRAEPRPASARPSRRRSERSTRRTKFPSRTMCGHTRRWPPSRGSTTPGASKGTLSPRGSATPSTCAVSSSSTRARPRRLRGLPRSRRTAP